MIRAASGMLSCVTARREPIGFHLLLEQFPAPMYRLLLVRLGAIVPAHFIFVVVGRIGVEH